SLVDDDGVTDAHVFTVDLVFVVERGAGNGGTVEEGGAQFGDGRDGTSTPDLEDNIFDNRGRLGRREFVGDGPTRRFGRRTEPFLMFGVIDFEDDAVDAVGEVVAFFGPVGEVFLDILEFFMEFPVGLGRYAQFFQGGENFSLTEV